MKTIIAGLAVGFGLLGTTSTAQASTFFELNSFSVELNDTDPGLVLDWQPLLDTPVSGTLMVDESKTVDLFKIWTNEVAINHDDLVKQPISVNFDFVLPEMFSGVIEGDTFGEKSGLWGFLQKGKVEWNSPSIFSFGNGGQLEVSLSDEAFNEGWFWGTKPGRKYGAIVEATFILKQESKPEAPPEKVPEPSSILGLSVLCFGVLRKKQLFKTA